jgi:RHS repeat-associated protein
MVSEGSEEKSRDRRPTVVCAKAGEGATSEPLTTYRRGVDLGRKVPAILAPANLGSQNVVNSCYYRDEQGNVIALVSPRGMMLAQYEYDPFGNLIARSGLMANVNKCRYSSKQWDANAGLYYYGYRFYDPNLRRWVNRDPIQEEGGLNLYELVLNDPINSENSDGLAPPQRQPPSPQRQPWKVPPPKVPLPWNYNNTTNWPSWPISSPVTNLVNHCQFTLTPDNHPVDIWWGPIFGCPGGSSAGWGVGITF